MTHLLTWLTDNVRSAAQKCGALGASVYVPTPWNHAAPGILVQVGSGAPLPELATLESARDFETRANAVLGTPADGALRTARVVASADAGGVLLPIPLLTELSRRAAPSAPYGGDSMRQLRRQSDHQDAPPIVGWLGLRLSDGANAQSPPTGWQAMLELATILASTYVSFYGILTDPITGLPGRAELNGAVRAELDRAHAAGLPFSLLFVKLEGVHGINERLGRRAGDAVVREFVEALSASIRSSDVIMRYGGTVFALPLRDVPSTGAMLLGEKIQRRISGHPFLDGTLKLECAIGVATCDQAESASLQPFELMRRADQALLASRRTNCSRAVLWSADESMPAADHLDPLLGVFTGQNDKDYRNMRLLWEVVQALSSVTDTDLSHAVVSRLFSLFAVTRAAFLQPDAHGALQLIAGRQRSAANATPLDLTVDDLRSEERRLNADAFASLIPQQCTLDASMFGHASAVWSAVAVPLVIEGRALGTLYLLGSSEMLEIDQSDFPVLASVAAQLAMALDRQQLAAQQRQRDLQEQRQLKAELEKLRNALTQARFVFRSKQMADLLNMTKRVAATEATVLITGESGTGKEMLAHMLHELSGRRQKPLVIVDCSAIPASLMDSELFGRERGAYTGAERRSPGRLAQADGGTVFLDEIGELPLEVQAKLLRFVQEKTLTMVGGTRAQRVDVRIIAATNRGLENEVRAGRFREDLFHRLNVVRLRIPPLRERTDDATLLASHFIETFANQYAKPIRALAPDAERLVASYAWPGNVRELQNAILQAVVLAEGELLFASDLQLPESRLDATAPARTSASAPQTEPAAPNHPDTAAQFDEEWRSLTTQLTSAIEEAVSSGTQLGLPLGKWLGRDLVLEAYEQNGRVIARAAERVGLPETTFARRLRQAEAEAVSTRQPESWLSVRAALAAVVRNPARPAGSLADQIDDLILGLIVARVPHRIAQAASLMGLSVPTMKRRMEETRGREVA